MSQIQHQIQNQIVKLQQDLNKLIQLSQNQMPTCSKDYIVETTPTGQEIIRLLDEDELQFIKCEPNEDEIEYNLPVHEEMYYLEQLDANKFIENRQLFECPICFTDINIGAGVVLKNCLHMFCKECLKATIEVSNDIHTKCPYTDYLGSCEFFLQESEVVSFASDEAIKKQHAESLKQAELSAAGTAFHCKHPDCNYWVFLDPELVGKFTCEVCGNRNCLNCKVVHGGKTCQQYQDEINPNAKNEREVSATQEFIQLLIASGEAMQCPFCDVVIEKIYGCDLVVCSVCKLKICWVTRLPRNDIMKGGVLIEGCKCGINGVLCHPACTNCH